MSRARARGAMRHSLENFEEAVTSSLELGSTKEKEGEGGGGGKRNIYRDGGK